MFERQCLKKTILLCGESDGKVFKRTFVIVKKISEGASAICYEAYHENSGRGVLKEFYPENAYALERTAEGQLIHPVEFQDAYERFLKDKKEYIAPYEMLLRVKQNSDNQELATFIPSFEIYHGCDEKGYVLETPYIWMPDPKLETFETTCNDIFKHPNINPEHKLVTVLTAIESLAKCICYLHSLGMIHRDIKPSNFGFVKRGNETLTQTLSLFDINSICSVYGKNDDVVGSEGYIEPEAVYEPVTNQTDIYSIGATLFRSLIVTEEVENNSCLYKPEYFSKIRDMVAESKLIQASEANSHPRLRNILSVILEKSLCERTYRYANCEEMLEDIKTALYYALPSDIAKKCQSGEKWILTDVEKSLDKYEDRNSFLAILYHLYEHPLYCFSRDNEETLNVLVIGFGNYGQKFLDACLQNGQMRNKKLNVTVVSDDQTDKRIYLTERPELSNFFNIDGSLDGNEDAYGNVTFEIMRLERGNQHNNSDILQTLMCERYDNKRPHYVFIALGEDELNMAAANACKIAIDRLEMNCIVSYVCESLTSSCDSVNNLFPLFINQDIKKHPNYSEIERMALNTHLVWENNLNLDDKSIRRLFRKPYNHDSCVSNVLSLKYKLYSIGINLDDNDHNEAARIFGKVISDKRNQQLVDELVWIEHRRWVTEKLCQGWEKMEVQEAVVRGKTKDEKNKRHICIVKSRPDQMLSRRYNSANYEKWDTASRKEIATLDDLDRVSIELHRLYTKKAEDAKRQNLLTGPTIVGIKDLIEGEKQAIISFQEWFACLKGVYNGDKETIRLYESLKNTFLQSLAALSEEKKHAVYEQVKAFESLFIPILASMEYRDWKQIDKEMIDNIPFVLTYSTKAYLAIPFSEHSLRWFDNLAAPTMINPSRILYLCFIEEKQDVDAILYSVPNIVEYMKKKHLKATVDYIFVCIKDRNLELEKTVKQTFIHRGEGRVRVVKELACESYKDIPNVVFDYLRKRAKGKGFFALENNKTRLSALLQTNEDNTSIVSYSFDSNHLKFELSDMNGEMLQHINNKPSIKVSEMLALQQSFSDTANNSEFYLTYDLLWEKYNKNRHSWKQMCDLLGHYSDENDVLVSFDKKSLQEKSENVSIYHYILPYSCYKAIDRVLQQLKKHHIIEKGSKVEGYTSDSCEILIIDRSDNKTKFDRLFANVYALMLPMDITVSLDMWTHRISIRFNNLMVQNISVPKEKAKNIKQLLCYFDDIGFINNLVFEADKIVKFTYGSYQIKELLTTAGKVLEIYTYHKVKETGVFDDVVGSYEVYWEKTDVKNEFDLILTKGFRALFVECKARPSIEQDFYYKISQLKDKFGINAHAVLIADTREKPFFDTARNNTMQRMRGSMMDVVTIWDKNEIDDIGHTLQKVIEGEYKPKEVIQNV